MQSSELLTAGRFLECLAADKQRLVEVAGDLDRSVPSCPDWTVRDLVHHVANVYLHKVACMRLGHEPTDWAPEHTEPALDRLERAYDELAAEFAARKPTDTAFTWYPPDQTVGFWIRRMAQETTVHRVDAELAVSALTPVPDDLAGDGIDEVLSIFLGWGTRTFGDMPEVAALLAEADGRSVAVRSGDRSFLVRPEAGGVQVSTDADTDDAAATISGTPSDVLLWLWNRIGSDSVRLDGDPALVGYFQRLMVDATQ